MDKASDFGSEDCRFESCHGRRKIHFFTKLVYLALKIQLSIDLCTFYLKSRLM